MPAGDWRRDAGRGGRLSQQINLFNPALRTQRLALSAATAAICVVIALLALFAFQIRFQIQVNDLTERLRAAQSGFEAQRADVDKRRAEIASRKKDTTLDVEIARLETELKRGRESIETLKSGAIGNQQGFAEYLRAFSHQSLNGLWLTGFTIGGGGDIAIQGRVTQPELVPNYIQRLNQEKILQGRTFAALELHAPKAEPAGAADKIREQKKAPPTPPYLEFSLSTAEPAGAAAGAGRLQ
jgi:hypothetical protein